MADAARSERPRPTRHRLSLRESWRRLNVEQRVAAVGAVLLIVSTLGPFSFVEAAIVLIGASVLLLLRRPLADVLELARQLLRGHVVRLVEDQLRLGLEAPRVGVGPAPLPRPDRGPILEHRAAHAHDRRERLDPRQVEDDPVTGLDLLRERTPALLHPDQAETALGGGGEVLRRPGQDPRPGGHGQRVTAGPTGTGGPPTPGLPLSHDPGARPDRPG